VPWARLGLAPWKKSSLAAADEASDSEIDRTRLREDSDIAEARGALRAYLAAALATTIAAAAVVSQKKSEQSLSQRHAFGGGRAMHNLSVRRT
jgi:hypothetical protein